MELFIFKTDIKNSERVKAIKPIFDNKSIISSWSVDTEDIDNVLKINSKKLKEKDIMQLIRACGFQCELLPD